MPNAAFLLSFTISYSFSPRIYGTQSIGVCGIASLVCRGIRYYRTAVILELFPG